MFEVFTKAIASCITPQALLVMGIGTVAGLVVGALPGLSSTMGVALAIPITFGMDPKLGLMLLGAVYCSSVYGGSLTAILLRTPGTDASIATTFDGFPMTQKGLGGKAIGVSTTGSFFGGIVSVFALLFLAPPLAKVALKFGSAEYFLVAIFGLSVIISISSASYLKGLISGMFGLLLSTCGMDGFTGYARFIFDNDSLLDGIPLLPALIGLFSLSQAIKIAVEKDATIVKSSDVEFTDRVMPTWAEFKHLFPFMARSSIIGTVIGIIPAAGTSIAAFLSYDDARRHSKHPETFGQGNPEGVVAPETANNAVTGGSLIPALTLAIPGNAVTAIFIGGLTIHGLIPGPSLFTKHAETTYTLIFSLFIANILFYIIGITFARQFAKIIKTPTKILAPVICVFSVIGSYAIRNNMLDVGILFGFGVLGYFMERYKYPASPIVLALILGPMAESEFRRSMAVFHNSITPYFTRPLSLALIVLIVISVAVPLYKEFKRGKAGARTQ